MPPSYPTFDIKSSVPVNKNNLTAQMPVSQASTTSTPIIIQLPSQFYQNSSFQKQLTLHNSNNTNTHVALPNTLLSIGEFLNSLDQKHNCNVYANFEDAFL